MRLNKVVGCDSQIGAALVVMATEQEVRIISHLTFFDVAPCTGPLSLPIAPSLPRVDCPP
jgi:hypothetical protein